MNTSLCMLAGISAGQFISSLARVCVSEVLAACTKQALRSIHRMIWVRVTRGNQRESAAENLSDAEL